MEHSGAKVRGQHGIVSDEVSVGHYVEQCAGFGNVTMAGEVGEYGGPANNARVKVSGGGILKEVSRAVVPPIG